MYSLIGPLLEGKHLYIISIPPQPSIVLDMDLSLILALSIMGIFLLVSRVNSQHAQGAIFIVMGMALAISAYLIQTYLSVWFPDLFITGNWYTFRNSLASILTYTAILFGAMVPAVYIVPRFRLPVWFKCLMIFFSALGTATLYNSYLNSVMMIPGSTISIPGWILAVSPFIASVAIATGLFGFFLIIREIFDYVTSWPGRIAIVAVLTAAAVLLTYQIATAVYAVIAFLILVNVVKRIPSLIIAAGMIILAIGCEIIGSWFAAMGPDSGQYVPVWVFPIIFMALITLVPAILMLPKFEQRQRILLVFCISWVSGMIVALAALLSGGAVFNQPDCIPQLLVSILMNCIFGTGIAALLYILVGSKRRPTDC
jgi:hypothetical protein